MNAFLAHLQIKAGGVTTSRDRHADRVTSSRVAADDVTRTAYVHLIQVLIGNFDDTVSIIE